MIDNIFDNIRHLLHEEVVDEIYSGEIVKVSRISSMGQTTDWFDSEFKEVAVLLEGAATIEFLDRSVGLKKGDIVIINPHEIHRVINTSPTGLWLAFYFKEK
jgi:mannose-6-phosphate isomerase-like protein (cupin superfamily)